MKINLLRIRIKDAYSKNLFLFQRGVQAIRYQGIHHFYTKFKYHYKRYDRWIKKNEITSAHYEDIKAEICGFQNPFFKNQPKISIIMPVYNVPARWLKKAIASVQRQLYENWELCIVDDSSSQPHIRKTLQTYSQSDSRIKVKFLSKNIGISGASNEALAMATGDFIGLLDNDDELSIDALYEVAKLLNCRRFSHWL